ncbi:MAG: hypothetical protein GXP55_10160 [Deltaproteobacteria bacterium]|nr:hypothetical protein [Deltaproteobacteria bacterium]
MSASRTTLLFALSGLAAALGIAYCHSGRVDDDLDDGPRALGSAPDDGGVLPGAVDAAVSFYASRPLHERTRPPLPVPAGLPDLSARTCGACHVEIYREWQASTHRHAWLDDAQFQAELDKNRHGAPYRTPAGSRQGDTSWICVRCHTPLSDQQPRLVVGLDEDRVERPRYVDNPRYDADLQDEAITCAVCHVRDDGVILGPFGDTDAPHPVARSARLRDGQVCLDCHQAEVRYDQAGLLCAFGTGREWQASSYAREGRACPSCHMPEVERPLASGRPARRTGRHWFGGSLIPKRPDLESQVAPLRAVYGSGVDVSLRRRDGQLELVVENTRAGHRVPTGDPERYVLVTAEALDARGRTLNRVTLRIGTVYDWSPPAHVVSDNRLAPGEEASASLGRVPEAASVRILGQKFRIGQEAFDYHDLEGRYVAGRVFHRSTWSVAGDAPEETSRVDDLHPAAPGSEAPGSEAP